MSQGNEDAADEDTKIEGCHEFESRDCTQDSASSCTSCQDLEMEQDSSGDQSSLNHSLYIPNNYMTKSMLCLNEESQDEVSHFQMALKSLTLQLHLRLSLAVMSGAVMVVS